MKYIYSPWLMILSLSIMISFSSCTDEEDVTKLNPTELEVRVIDIGGNPVSGASVKIFRNRRDLELISREVATATTNGQGIAKFAGLQPVNYFFYASITSGGSIISNYGNYNESVGDNGSNYDLADILTENAVSRISISLLFSRPSSPSTIDFKSLQIYYSGDDTDFPEDAITDTLITSVYFFKNDRAYADFNDLVNNSIQSHRGFFYDRFPSQIGNDTIYDFDYSVSIQELVDYNSNPDNSVSLYGIIPITRDSDTSDYFYDFENSQFDIGLDFYFLQALQSGQLPIRYNIGQIFYGNDIYALDINLEWK